MIFNSNLNMNNINAMNFKIVMNSIISIGSLKFYLKIISTSKMPKDLLLLTVKMRFSLFRTKAGFESKAF